MLHRPLLIVAILLAGCAASEQSGVLGPAGPPEGPHRAQMHRLPVTQADGSARMILMRLCRPAGDAPARLVVINHGSPGNVEARAAQYYFPALFGADFRRNRELEGANALLNYGYTVLRAATARAIVAAGLHPSLGIFHKSRGDAFRLSDDVMEPFRPTTAREASTSCDDSSLPKPCGNTRIMSSPA